MGVVNLDSYRKEKYNDNVGRGFDLRYEPEYWWVTYKKISLQRKKEKEAARQLEREHAKAWMKLLSN